MSGALIGRLGLTSLNPSPVFKNLFHTSTAIWAARKGTREKARKKKVKVEVKKIGFIPHNQRDLDRLKLMQGSKRSIDKRLDEPLDTVFATKYYKTIVHPISYAVQCHRESNHPTMRNKPYAPVNVTIELNMVAEKKTRFMDSFHRIVNIPFPTGTYEDRTILAFCKTPEQVEEALNAGANVAGGNELIPKIQSGDLDLHEFKFVISHPSMLADLVPIRGLLKRKFPVAKSGTLGPDLTNMVRKFKQGLQYKCEKDPDEHDLGIITTSIGSLDMEDGQLEANYAALVKDVEEARPRRSGDFITWVWCTAEPSPERFKVEFNRYLEAESCAQTSAS